MDKIIKRSLIALLAFFGTFAIVAGVIVAKQDSIHLAPFFFSALAFTLIKLLYDNGK